MEKIRPSWEYKLPKVSLCLTLLLIACAIEVQSFVPWPVSSRRIATIYGVTNGPSDESDDEDSNSGQSAFDVEDARKKLEILMSTSTDAKEENFDNEKAVTSSTFGKLLFEYSENEVDFSLSSLPPPPPLSAIERNRRLVEIRLLECLMEGDDAISELWDHWYSERGSATKSRLDEVGEMFMDRFKWKTSEEKLIELVDEFGIYFVEPVNLLATLYYIQGKYKLSYKLCELILSIKPYHVGALSGIVQVAANLGDAEAVRYWAAKRLPSVVPRDNKNSTEKGGKDPENGRRAEWVDQAISDAKEQLEQAEQRTQKNFFGKADDYKKNLPENTGFRSNELNNVEDDEGAWQ